MGRMLVEDKEGETEIGGNATESSHLILSLLGVSNLDYVAARDGV